ncbi:SCY1-like protein 2 [Silurus asotus]|uniref:SCY1-like protein 2 n=1 Tax=Silurus asotus TaxID=30991 RepID=A0AAD5FI24_SILAS|nr:SCY1-like protein 2 [Silurus asotus]
MESMLNKLKSTVTKVTADVTSAVMGNPVTREFEVGRHIASGGPGMSWRIYNGTKKSTKQVSNRLTGDQTMESMLNKLKSTVTKVTADVTSAVMGNPVTREFEVGRHIASGGPGMSWRIYNGTKKSTKQEVAVFVFDKKVVDRYQKFEKDQIIDSLKRGVQQLTRLRHPRLLTVQHPLEESRDCLAFCTEPVFASLANVLGQWDNLPSPVPTDIKEHKLFDVETKYGLLQISEGLSFLHNGVKMVHGNLCTENIILNKSGAWKIMGFDFSISSSNPSDAEPKYVCKEWDPNLPPLCLPNPEYVAPEYILSVSCETASDMYSLGVVMHAVFNEGKPVFQVNKMDIFKSFSRQLDQLSRLSPGVLSKIPEEVREHVKMLLSVTANVRPDADQMTKIPFFDDVGARVIVYRILPALTSEFVNPDMVPFVLPNVLLIAEECTKEEYIRLILPDLTPVFKQQEPVQILLIFLQKMDLLLTKTPAEDIKNSVLPMVYRALEAPSIQIQELCLNIIPTFANLIEYPSMKNALIPRIKTACLQTSSLAVRVNSLVCLGKILEYLDKWFVIDEILPFLQQIPSREPAVLMGILGIYKCTFTHKKLGIPKEHLAAKSLPHLVSLSIDNNLNLNQFNSFMAVIRDMLSRMEAEHKTKLEQLHSMQEQQRSLNLNQINPPEETKSNPSPPSKVHDIDDIFGANSACTGVNGKENGSSTAPFQPSRVSLTLEEKQRLAKEQEQAAKLRNQQPLAPQNIKPTTTSTAGQAKDLTSSLLNNMTSLNSLSLTSGPRTAPMQTGALSSGFSSTASMAPISNGPNSPMGFQAGGMGMRPAAPGLYGGIAGTSNTPNFNAHSQNQNQSGKPPDLSALDSLFSANKPKVSLNQMVPKPTAGTTSSPWMNQFGTGQPSQTAPMQAVPMGMTGVQGGFGMQANPFFSPQNFSQPNAAVPTMKTGMLKQSMSVNNDLKDLFG